MSIAKSLGEQGHIEESIRITNNISNVQNIMVLL